MKTLRIQFLTIAIAFVAFSLFSGLPINAAPGDLDVTFGTGGKVLTQIGTAVLEARSIYQQADGKLLVSGKLNNATSSYSILLRYNADGSIDSSFGNNGFVYSSFNSGLGETITCQSDGKILVSDGTNLVRYNSNGEIDNYFGFLGAVSANGNTVEKIVALPDGKILVRTFARIVKLNSDGSRDTSFDPVGNDGEINTTTAGRDLLVLPDGKIVAGGYNVLSGQNVFDVRKFNADGSVDTGFGTNGRGQIYSAFRHYIAEDAKIQSDGKIVLAGFSFPNGSPVSGNDFAAARFNADGSVDTSFGTGGDGVALAAVSPNEDRGYTAVIQTDDKILLSGFTNNGTNRDFAVVRFNANGTLDNSLAVQENKSSKNIKQFSLKSENDANLWSNLDSSLWGPNGIVSTDFGGDDVANGMIQIPGGKVILAGTSSGLFALARYEGFAPTVASSHFSGRVIKGKNRGVGNAIVHITMQSGNIKTARTNQFGYFRFENVDSGQTLIVNAFHREYQFNSQLIKFDGSIKELTITTQ